ncbi:hypothetical protein K435DRAFT_624417, partial [Dendrothele bispora CBS 962.96]
FDQIDERVILEITRHEFRPYNLHKLDKRVRDRADRSEGGLDALLVSSGSAKEYPTLDSLLVPLQTFFSILIEYARISGSGDVGCILARGSLAYLAHITELACKYKWSAVLSYHMSYHAKRRQEMKKGRYNCWGATD